MRTSLGNWISRCKDAATVRAGPRESPPVLESPVLESPVLESPVLESPVFESLPVLDAVRCTGRNAAVLVSGDRRTSPSRLIAEACWVGVGQLEVSPLNFLPPLIEGSHRHAFPFTKLGHRQPDDSRLARRCSHSRRFPQSICRPMTSTPVRLMNLKPKQNPVHGYNGCGVRLRRSTGSLVHSQPNANHGDFHMTHPSNSAGQLIIDGALAAFDRTRAGRIRRLLRPLTKNSASRWMRIRTASR